MTGHPRTHAADALLGMLLPFWQIVIGLLVLFAVVMSISRLARRGQSRMTTGLLVVAATILGVAALSMLMAD